MSDYLGMLCGGWRGKNEGDVCSVCEPLHGVCVYVSIVIAIFQLLSYFPIAFLVKPLTKTLMPICGDIGGSMKVFTHSLSFYLFLALT